ncbi:UNVERIFIED_CONTAM: nucleoside-diphosphate-sugar epimerase [Brevibacillus sp. OAP136]
MRSALVLGGTQFFGKRLVQLLLDAGVEVTIGTRGKTADPFGDRVQRLVLDREDAESMESAVEGKSWDVIYDQTCYSPQEALDACYLFSGNTKRYIFTSTMAVYDGGTAQKEEDFSPFSYAYSTGNRREYPGIAGYTEAKRSAEAVLFQKEPFPVVAVRFPLVIGPDDYTNRLRFHVEHVVREQPIGISHPDTRIGFISSEDASRFLFWLGTQSFVGPINAGYTGDISHRELLERIGHIVGKEPLIIEKAEPEHQSPYAFPWSWSLDTEKARSAGFTFGEFDQMLDSLIRTYAKDAI